MCAGTESLLLSNRPPLQRGSRAFPTPNPLPAERGGGKVAQRTPAGRLAPRAFTLAECLIASVVLAASVIAIFGTLNSGQAQMNDSSLAKLATGLGEEMMERVLALSYTDPDGAATPGPDAGESTPDTFDNMDDYQGYAESAGEVKDANGTLMPGNYQVFGRNVTAQYTMQTVAALGGPIAGLQVTVTVKDRRGRAWTVSRFVAAGAHTLPTH